MKVDDIWSNNKISLGNRQDYKQKRYNSIHHQYLLTTHKIKHMFKELQYSGRILSSEHAEMSPESVIVIPVNQFSRALPEGTFYLSKNEQSEKIADQFKKLQDRCDWLERKSHALYRDLNKQR